MLRHSSHRVNVRGETGRFGLLDYFDISDPRRPRRIGKTLEADGPLQNGVVSDDGSRVAVEIMASDGSTAGWKVVVFQRVRKTLSAPRVVVPMTTANGLQFEGRFLFVGMQRPPVPFTLFMVTESVSLFDVGR